MQAYYKIVKKFSSIQSEQSTTVSEGRSVAIGHLGKDPGVAEPEVYMRVSLSENEGGSVNLIFFMYKELAPLGRGAYGEVCLVEHIRTRRVRRSER